MGSEENRDMLSLERSSNNNVINCSSSEDMVTNAMRSDSIFKSSNALDPYYNSSWDPNHIVSLNQCGNFPNPSMIHQAHFADSHVIGGDSSHLVPITSDPSLVDVLPNIANYSEMARYNSNFARKTLVNVHKPSMNTLDSHENCQNSDNVMLGSSSHYGKRKRKMSPKNTEKEQQKDLYVDSCEAMPKEDETFRQNIDSDSRNKQLTKQVKDSNSNGEEPSKANYIHVRAKRGQATNSHSLAERVRRERISERMRLLQELVPGCNKITGKAVMLDEIINYVQSLQQQVEFLSMKLATVNPEIDIDHLLTKDILHLQGNNTNAFGINPGSSSTSQHFLGYPQGTFNGTTQPFNQLSQHIWNNELQGILQMGFDPQPSSSSLGPNGLSKMNL